MQYNNSQIPTEDDWRSEPFCLDIACAYRNFLGKNLEEARALFVENAFRYEGDLKFMPYACFQYYLRAYLNYLTSDDSQGDADGASCFFGLINQRSPELANNRELRQQVCETLAHVGTRQDWYDADEEIDGSFREKAAELLEKLNSL